MQSGKPSSDEIEQIRSQLQSLMQRVDRLEAETVALKSENDQLKVQTDEAKVNDSIVAGIGNAPASNWVLNATYSKNVNNKDVGAEYDFDRLMLDLNTRF